MHTEKGIRLLAAGTNEIGELFTRLSKDLFFAIGYDGIRMDVHKSGREIDIQGQHRMEARKVIAECKAHGAKIGGADINKFLGVLTRERKKSAPLPIAGYFVSLAGFTETSIEQELEMGDDGVILLKGNDVVEQLIASRVIVDFDAAVHQAATCLAARNIKGLKLEAGELLGHERGYLWAIFYSLGKKVTHFSLIHADGTSLSASIAGEIIKDDLRAGGTLNLLEYIAPIEDTDIAREETEKALESYKTWLSQECGFIQLDGLPADSDLSAARLRIERLFIPLRANPVRGEQSDEEESEEQEDSQRIGELLERSQHLAVLAMPGGGKSTLLKRLATAYAFPERRGEVEDSLPNREWLPVVLRCRELKDKAQWSIIDLIGQIPSYVGMNTTESNAFREYIHAALRTGKVLLLIDGLDEISEEGSRRSFAQRLRTFLAVFPLIATVITSREAGFRIVAGSVASVCLQVKLAPLAKADVLNLCEKWHVEVIGDTPKVRADAIKLGNDIWSSTGLRTLCENPLLLTTLLVVKRNMRELPRNRAALYREAIRVLVRTWNVEGYQPLDEEETLAQLSYIACAMIEEGKQQIGQIELLNLLKSAREELEAELQFVKISAREFIERIEYRSSLLLQTGHARLEGVVQPVYEFRHLTFQEYLAARGYVEEQHRLRSNAVSLEGILSPHFDDVRWLEVISLASALAGRKSGPLIGAITEHCDALTRGGELRSIGAAGHNVSALLLKCMQEDLQIAGSILRNALLVIGRLSPSRQADSVEALMQSKFAEMFKELVFNEFAADREDSYLYMSTLADIYQYEFPGGDVAPGNGVLELLSPLLDDPNDAVRVKGALLLMHYAYGVDGANRQSPKIFDFGVVNKKLSKMLDSKFQYVALAAAWALAWVGRAMDKPQVDTAGIISKMSTLWAASKESKSRRYFAWSLYSQPIADRGEVVIDPRLTNDFLRAQISEEKDGFSAQIAVGALFAGWYKDKVWSDSELAEVISDRFDNHSLHNKDLALRLLTKLGPEGEMVLKRIKSSSEKSNTGTNVKRSQLKPKRIRDSTKVSR